MSLLSRVTKFAKSPQGKKLMKQAQDVAKDPKTKEKIAEARGRLAGGKDKPGSTANPPAGTKPPGPPPRGSS